MKKIIENKKYYIFCFGRHSDLLNLAFEIKKTITLPNIETKIFCNNSIIDGERISEHGAEILHPRDYLSLISSFNKDVVLHSLSPSFLSFLICFIGKIFGASVFYNIHRFDFDSYKGLKKVGVFLYTFAAFFISNIIYVHVKNKKKFLFWSEKIIYAQLPSFINQSNKVNEKIRGDEVLFFGRIDSNKGLDLLVEIIKMAPHHKFRISGEIIDRSLLAVLEKISVLENVSVKVGRVGTSELHKLFQNASLVILPYSNGTQSGIPPLAKSLKTPVLLSDVGELREAVKNNIYGECVSSRDPKEWIKYLDNVDWFEKRSLIAKKLNHANRNDIYLEYLKNYV